MRTKLGFIVQIAPHLTTFSPGEAKAARGRCRTKGTASFKIKQYDKLKFEKRAIADRPYEVANRAGPMV